MGPQRRYYAALPENSPRAAEFDSRNSLDRYAEVWYNPHALGSHESISSKSVVPVKDAIRVMEEIDDLIPSWPIE